jgi:heterodisulfide reductase subunit C
MTAFACRTLLALAVVGCRNRDVCDRVLWAGGACGKCVGAVRCAKDRRLHALVRCSVALARVR